MTMHLLAGPGREVFRDALGCSDLQWRRGMAWALAQALGLGWYYVESNPPLSRLGRRTVERLLLAVGD